MKAVLQTLSLLTLSILLFSSGLMAQSDSQYSVRFTKQEVNCADEIIYLDLEVKALEGQAQYYISDQNYRFSFNRGAVENPRIVQELELSGTTFSNEYSAFFDAHHLNGSLDTVVSYNVVLSGGTGYPIDDTRWYPVGRIAFDILDQDQCLQLKWHTHDPVDFPPTFIGEKVANTLFELEEGSYDNGGPAMDASSTPIACFNIDCNPLFPVELESFEALDKGCETELYWTTATETDNEYFSIEKSSDGVRWVSIGTLPGSGTTTDPQTYRFVDKVINEIVSYYRIKQVDFNGDAAVSNSVIVRSSCYNEEIAIGITDMFPNPAFNDDRVNIKFYTERGDSEATILITDELGRIVKEIQVDLREGPNTLSFESTSLASGIYFVQVKGDNWFSIVQKLVKITK